LGSMGAPTSEPRPVLVYQEKARPSPRRWVLAVIAGAATVLALVILFAARVAVRRGEAMRREAAAMQAARREAALLDAADAAEMAEIARQLRAAQTPNAQTHPAQP